MQVIETSNVTAVSPYNHNVSQDCLIESRNPFASIRRYEDNRFCSLAVHGAQQNSPLAKPRCQKQEPCIPYRGRKNASNLTVGTESVGQTSCQI